jgi:hypothetical protein
MRNVERSMIIRECVVHLTIVQVTSLVGVSGFSPVYQALFSSTSCTQYTMTVA